MTRTALSIPAMALVAALGCGRSMGDDSNPDASSNTRPDASSNTRPDAGSGDDAAPPLCDPTTVVDAGAATASDAAPINHRPSPACCPAQRGPGTTGQPYPPGVASTGPDGCSSDSQCTAGVNGRCFPFGGLAGPGGCSYDECFTDSACGSKTPCDCRGSSTDNSANACLPGGDCAVDSDCGPGGYCSPSAPCGQGSNTRYYCHTAQDTCLNDSDCPPPDAGTVCETISSCAYSTQEHHWACTQQLCCPP